MKTGFYSCLALFLCIVLSTASLAQSTPLSINGKLRVINRQLCNEAGTPIQLRGMSSHGLHWFPNCYTASSVQALARDWGADIFRSAMYVDEGGYVNDPAGLRAKVNQIVDWTAQVGIYNIIDWHILNPGDPNVHLNEAKEFFRIMAQRNAGKKNVLYEICNEPNGVQWSSIKSYAEQVIPVIRTYDTAAIILVGTPNYSGTPGDVRSSPLTGANAYNVMYTFHFYAGSHNTQSYLDDVLKSVPLFISEWGTSNYSGNGGDNYSNAQSWLNLLAGGNSSGIKVSWTNWNFADKNETSSALQQNACSMSAWNSTSTSGAWVKDHILNPADNFGPPSSGGNKPPVVSLTAPAQNATYTAPASVTFTASASDPDGSIVKVEYYSNGNLLATSASQPYQFTWTGVGAGTYSLTAKATDNTGASTVSAAVAVTVNAAPSGNKPPVISLTAPAQNAVYTAPASITLAASASDPDGSVSKVEYYRNGTLLATSTSQPYQFTWSGVAAGSYSLTARATDNAGASTVSQAVTVAVNPASTGGSADISGPDCVAKNDVKVFQVSAANQAGATSYSWWVNGSSQSVAANGSSATVSFGLYFTGGQVCAGVNYSAAPWYKQLCKTVSVCNNGMAVSGAVAPTEVVRALVYPTVSRSSFTLHADKNIAGVEVVDESGRVYQHLGKQTQGQTLQFGQQLVTGQYLIRIGYEDRSYKILQVMKVK